MSIEVINLGLIEYEKALTLQKKYLELVQENTEKAYLIVCSHPPVITVGRAAKEKELSNLNGSVVKVSRGGKETYHGPNQLVVYPIISLQKNRTFIKAKDIKSYLDALTQVCINFLKHFEVSGNPLPKNRDLFDPEALMTGVWVDNRKIASIGVSIKKWCSLHGLAINLFQDDMAFKGINPCGFESHVMISLEEVMNKKHGSFMDKSKSFDFYSEIFVSKFKSYFI